jgi:hypothetical protein
MRSCPSGLWADATDSNFVTTAARKDRVRILIQIVVTAVVTGYNNPDAS